MQGLRVCSQAWGAACSLPQVWRGQLARLSCERRREQHSAVCLLSRVNVNTLGLPDLVGINSTVMFLPVPEATQVSWVPDLGLSCVRTGRSPNGSMGCSCSTNPGCARLLWTGSRSAGPELLRGRLLQQSWALGHVPAAVGPPTAKGKARGARLCQPVQQGNASLSARPG